MPAEFKNIKLLNLGCGNHHNPDWVNIDFNSSDHSVISFNLLKGIPFSENEFDAVYHSHLLEHFPKSFTLTFLQECFRVLKKDGILRVVIPDLEMIARNYIKWLDLAVSGNLLAQENHEWILLELYDQTVRNFPGGNMGKYLIRNDLTNKSFIQERIGNEVEIYWNKKLIKQSFIEKLQRKRAIEIIQYFRNNLSLLAVRLISGKKVESALKEGLFRQSGEIHQWMYDRYSLEQLLIKAGFSGIRIQSAYESQIANFGLYELDVVKGEIRKPDSLFMEATKK